MKNSTQHVIIGLLCLIMGTLNDVDGTNLWIAWGVLSAFNFIMSVLYSIKEARNEKSDN